MRFSLILLAVLSVAPAARADACVAVPLLDDRCERWVAVHDGHAGQSVAGGDAPVAIASDPEGGRVFTLTTTKTPQSDEDTTVLAYRQSDGLLLWTTTLASEGRVPDSAGGLAVDGDRVFLTSLTDTDGLVETTVLALDAGTGRPSWERTFAFDGAERTSLTVLTPAGDALYVGGSLTEPPADSSQDVDGLVLALDATTGGERWRAREEGLASGSDTIVSLAVPPSQGSVIAAVASQGRAEAAVDVDFLTIAYEAEDEETLGEELWRARYDGGARGLDLPADLELDADGTTAYVAGTSLPAGAEASDYDIVVRSYAVADGAPGPAARYDGPLAGFDVAADLALSSDGRTIVTTGLSARLPQALGVGSTTLGAWAATGSGDIVVVGHDAATGAERWVTRYEPAGFPYSSPAGLVVAGTRAYVTGFSYSGVVRGDAATFAVDTSDGSLDWVARYNSHDTTKDFVQPAGIAAGGGRVFVAARLAYSGALPGTNAVDVGTLAYDV